MSVNPTRSIDLLQKDVAQLLSSKKLKITDVFLQITSKELRLVEKRSLKGQWLRLNTAFRRHFFKKDKTAALDIARGLKEASEALTQVKDATTASYLEQLKAHVLKRRDGVDPELEKIHFSALKTIDDLSQLFSEEDSLASLPNTLSEDEKKLLLTLLAGRGDAQQILLAARVGGFLPLSLFIEEMLAQPADQEERRPVECPDLAALRAILDKLPPPQATEAPVIHPWKHFGNILGDAFLQNSGLEGDVTPAGYKELIAQFMSQYKQDNPIYKELQKQIQNAVDLRDLNFDSKAAIAQLKKEKRLLLLGGWQSHALVYEIIRQKNGLYTFRVYNQGKGIDFHPKMQEPYRTKYTPCVGICDISEKRIIEGGVLPILQQWTSSSASESFFYDHFLTLLRGRKEPVVDHYVLPQRSGTCLYRSFHAYIDTYLTQTESKQWHLSFRLFILKTYLPLLQALQPPTGQSSYDEQRLIRSLLDRSITKLNKTLKKPSLVISKEQLQEAIGLIATYEAYIKKIDTHLRAWEKSQQVASVTALSGPVTAITISAPFSGPTPSSTARTLPPPVDHQKQLELYALLQTPPLAVEEILTSIDSLTETDKSWWINQLFRQFASVAEWKAVRFRNPKQAYHTLKRLIESIPEGPLSLPLQLFAKLGMENAFSQMDDARWCPAAPSILNSDAIKAALASIHVTDPVWSKLCQEMCATPSSRPLNNPCTARIYEDPFVVACFQRWWFAEEQKTLRETIHSQVKEEKQRQEKEIKATREELQKISKSIDKILKELDEAERKDGISSWQDRMMSEGSWRENFYLEKRRELITRERCLEFNLRSPPPYWPIAFAEAVEALESNPSDATAMRALTAFLLSTKVDRLYNTGILATSLDSPLPRKHVVQSTEQCFAQHHLSLPLADFREHLVFTAFGQHCEGSKPIRQGMPLCYIQWMEAPSLLRQSKDPTTLFVPEGIGLKQEKEFFRYLQAHRFLEPLTVKSVSEWEGVENPDARPHFELRPLLLSARADEGKPADLEGLLHFFEENSGLFENPEWITLFHGLLIENDDLGKAFAQPMGPLLAIRFRQFFQGQIRSAHEIGNHTKAAQLCWLATTIQAHAARAGCKETIIEVTALTECLEKIAQGPPEMRGDGCKALLACYAYQECFPPHSLLAVAYVASFFAEHTRAEYQDQYLTADVKQAGQMLDREFLQDPTHFIQALQALKELHQFFPDISFEGLQAHPNNPDILVNKEGDWLVVLSRRWIPQTVKPSLLEPRPIREEHRRKLVEEGLLTPEKALLLSCTEEGNTTYIIDPERHLQFRWQETRLDIHKEGVWFHYLFREQRRTDLTHQPAFADEVELDRRYHLLVDSESRVHYCDKHSFKSVYQREGVDGQVTDSEGRTLSAFPEGTPFAFEESKRTWLWSKNHQLERIEFPRYQFALNRTGEQWEVEGKAGWFLATNQKLPRLGGFIGAFILQNQAEEKEVWLPMRELRCQADLSLNLPLELKPDEDFDKRALVYKLEGDNLVPSTMQARYYLAYLYLSLGFLDEAEKLLAPPAAEVTSRQLSEEEAHWLRLIVHQLPSGSREARVARLQLHALYLIGCGGKDHHISSTEEEKKGLDRLLKTYLTNLSEIEPLPPHEELWVFETRKAPQEVKIEEAALFDRRYALLRGEKPSLPSTQSETTHVFFDTARKWEPLSSHPLARSQKLRLKILGLPSHLPNLSLMILRISSPATALSPSELRTMNFDILHKTHDQILYARLSSIQKSQVPLQLYHIALFHSDPRIRKAAQNILELWFDRCKTASTLPTPAASVHPVGPTSLYGALKQQVRSFQVVDLPEPTQSPPVAALTNEQPVEPLPPSPIFEQESLDPRANAMRDAMRGKMAHLTVQPRKVATDGAMEAVTDALREARLCLETEERLIQESLKLVFLTEPLAAVTIGSHERHIPTLPELALLLTKQDEGQTLKHLYPEIQEVEPLRQAIHTWLKQKTEVQHLTRVLEKPELISAERAHQDEMLFLLLEMACDVRLRPEQVANIREFLAAHQRGESIALSMIMGSGKTALIQPLLAFLLAEERLFSTVTVPTALFPTLRDKLAATLGNTFSQSLFALPVNRKSTTDLQFLKEYLKKLQQIKARRGCLITTPMEKYTLLGALYNACYEKKSLSAVDPLLDERIGLLSEINALFEFESQEQMEEIDLLADSQTVFRSTCGSRVQLDTERGMLISSMLASTLTDPLIYEKVGIESCHLFHQRAHPSAAPPLPPLTPELFESVVKPRLIFHASQLLGVSLERLEGFVHEPTNSAYWPEQEELQQKFGAVALSIEILSGAMGKVHRCDFGIHPDNMTASDRFVARPFAAANVPKTTRYLEPYEQVIYSQLATFCAGVPEESARRLLVELRHNAQIDMGRGTDWHQTESYRRLTSIWRQDPPLGLLKEPHDIGFIKAFHEKMNSSIEGIMWHITHQVLPQVTYYERNVTLTPQTVMHLNARRYGYTGTPHEGILPLGMRVVGATDTEARIVQAVDYKLAKGTSRLDAVESDPLTYFNERIADPDVHMIIDSGGWLKNVTDIPAWLPHLKLRAELSGVIFHDKERNLMVWKKEDRTIEPFDAKKHKSERGGYLTLLEEQYETGVDVTQPPTAKAIMTLRKGMQLRDAAQSLFRMRQLLEGQDVIIAVNREVRAHMGVAETITRDSLWHYLISQQVLVRGDKSWLAADQRLRESLEGPLRRQFLRANRLEQRMEIFNYLEPMVIHPFVEQPFVRMTTARKKQPKEQACEALLEKYRAERIRVEPALQGGREQRPSDDIFNHCIQKEELAAELSAPSAYLGGEVEMEGEQETEQHMAVEQEMQMQVEMNSEWEETPRIEQPFLNITTDLWVNNTTQCRPGNCLAPFDLPLIPAADFLCSPNLYLSSTTHASKDYFIHHLPSLYFARLDQGSAAPAYVLLSFQDVKEIKKRIETQGCPPHLTVCSFTGSVVCSPGIAAAKALQDNGEFWQRITPMLAHAKFLTGWTDFSPPELAVIQEMVTSSPELIAHYEALLSWIPGSLERYHRSRIYSILHASV